MNEDFYQHQLALFVQRLQRAIPKNSSLTREIGALLNKSPNTIQRKMRGEINIPLEEYLKIARTFGVAIDPDYPFSETPLPAFSEPDAPRTVSSLTMDFGLLLAQLLWLSRQFNTRIIMAGGELPWFWGLNSPRLFTLYEMDKKAHATAELSHWAGQLERTLDRMQWGVIHTPDEIEVLVHRLLLEYQSGRLERDTCADELEILKFGIVALEHRLRNRAEGTGSAHPFHALISRKISNPIVASYCDGWLHQVHTYIDGIGLIRCQAAEHPVGLQTRIDRLLEVSAPLSPENYGEWEVVLYRWQREVEWGLDRLLSTEINV